MCAVIRRGILGGFSNKIGNIVGTSWKGIAVMKSLPLSVANPQTALQQETRGKFKTVSQIGSKLLANIIKPLWDRFAQSESGYNAFVKENFNNVSDDGTFNSNALVTSKGKMAGTDIATFVAHAATDIATVTWLTTLLDQYQLSTDLVYVVVYNVELNKFFFNTGVVVRSAGTIAISIPGTTVGDTMSYWLSFKRADGTVVSNNTIEAGLAVT